MNNPKKTALHSMYAKRDGVRLVVFGGWEMPIQFEGGILAEHRAVRSGAGLFDVSHMGEISVSGPDAGVFLDYLLTNSVSGAEPGRSVYSPMCRDDGGTVDDLLVYVLGGGEYLLVVNAANTDSDRQWISGTASRSDWNVTVVDLSRQFAQLALQGPGAADILAGLADDFSPGFLNYYRHARHVAVAGAEVLLSRTGYTGEDGFELYCSPGDAEGLWNELEGRGAVPCGLGARDLLRLEAALPLYGHELTADISPLEAGLGRFVKFGKAEFRGREALAAQKENGVPRRLRGLEMTEAGVPREGYRVYARTNSAGLEDDEYLGAITSGGKSPVRESFIALALLDAAVEVGELVDVEIRGQRRAARVVQKPFYIKPIR